jgi:hypothetical protein
MTGKSKVKPPLDWEYEEGKAIAFSHKPMAVYTVTEIPQRRKSSLFSTALLTEEWGWISIGRPSCSPGLGCDFRTMHAAQQLCENDVKKWRQRSDQMKLTTT